MGMFFFFFWRNVLQVYQGELRSFFFFFFEFVADFVGREARSCLQKLGGGIPGNVAAEPGLNSKYKSKLCIGSLVFKLQKMCSVSAFYFLGSDVVVREEPYILQSC